MQSCTWKPSVLLAGILVVCCSASLASGQVRLEEEPVEGFKPTRQKYFFSADSRWKQVWGKGEFTEGPAVAQDGTVFFSDIGNRILNYDPSTGKVFEFRNPSNRSNGLFFRKDGTMVICEGANTGGGRRISSIAFDKKAQPKSPKAKTIVDQFQGRKLNSPNDLFVTPKGNIFFTDPRYVGDEPVELDFQGVFRVKPSGLISIATKELTRPNGILIDNPEKHAFVAEHHPTGDKHLVRFAIGPEGRFSTPKILFDFGQHRGIDGMCFGPEGNIFATAGDGENSGIYVFSTSGKQLAFQPTPGAPTNCTFGKGKQSRRLYLTSAISRPANEEDSPKYGLFYLDIQN